MAVPHRASNQRGRAYKPARPPRQHSIGNADMRILRALRPLYVMTMVPPV